MITQSTFRRVSLCFLGMGVAGMAQPPAPWGSFLISDTASKSVMYLPVAHPDVKSIPINESGEGLIDLLDVDNSRICPLASFDDQYANSYEGYSKVRVGVYEALLRMLELLPDNMGIAYFEGFRPLHQQKQYFDNKLKEILEVIPDPYLAYEETCKHVSPFIDNIPTHTTGAAIDMTLFVFNENGATLLDMGKFDVIFGPNDAQETFSENTTDLQRSNRLLLLEAAAIAGLANYGYEWWHYSYGDKMWAYVFGQPSALYGLAVSADDPILSIDKRAYLELF